MYVSKSLDCNSAIRKLVFGKMVDNLMDLEVSRFSFAYPDVANRPTVKQANRPTDPEMENRPTFKQSNGQIVKWSNRTVSTD